MLYQVFFTSGALREYKKLPAAITRDIRQMIDGEFGYNPLSKTLDVKKLKVPFPGYRLRIGSYRMLFTIEGKEVIVYSIKHRKDAYK